MKYEGNILKMRVEYDHPVRYYLPLGKEETGMNDLIGHRIRLSFSGTIHCISCGKVTRTSYGQGFCYSCLQTAPEASESVLQPELSKAHFGVARDIAYAREHDLIDHVVYLAMSPDVKVGVTRHHQVPIRWIDQGANAAVIVARTPNRHIAGIMEVWLKQYYSDKTNWREMLMGRHLPAETLLTEKERAASLLTPELKKYLSANDDITLIDYPVTAPPRQINSLTFDKTPVVEGVLTGIRGQYLMIGHDQVINMRRHSGYLITLEGMD